MIFDLINKCGFHLLKYGRSTDWTSGVKFTILTIIITIDSSGEDGTAGAGTKKTLKVFCDDKRRNGHVNLGLD